MAVSKVQHLLKECAGNLSTGLCPQLLATPAEVVCWLGVVGTPVMIAAVVVPGSVQSVLVQQQQGHVVHGPKPRQLAPRNILLGKSTDLFMRLYQPAMQCWLKITEGKPCRLVATTLVILSELELDFDSCSAALYAEGVPYF